MVYRVELKVRSGACFFEGLGRLRYRVSFSGCL